MDKEDFKQLKSTVKQWLFHTGQLDPTDYANELKLKFIEPREKRITELEAINKKISDECHKLVDSFEIKQNENVELIRKVAFLENDLNNAKAQIEKMKCCENCKHCRKLQEMEILGLDKEPCNVCNKHDKWELRIRIK